MMQDVNPYGQELERFVCLTPYELAIREQVELLYRLRDHPVYAIETFGDFESAARKASSLGHDYHVFVGTTSLTRDEPGEGQNRFLAFWVPVHWPGRLFEDFSILLQDDPHPVWAECRYRSLDEMVAIVTVRFYYPDRCRVPERVWREAEVLPTRSKRDVGGWRGRL
jgi:hypothetical protein